MSEILNTFLLTDPETAVPMDRDDFYKEQIAIAKKTGKPTRAAEVVSVLIFNSSEELLVQKRNYHKAHNPGLLDKSIGGHVRYGDTANYSVMVETVQELQTPSIVLKNLNDFNKTLNLLDEYLTTIAIVKHSLTELQIWDRIVDGKKVKMVNKVNAYFGIYDGSIKAVDREAKGVLFYTLDELDQEIKAQPETFTHDLRVLVDALRPDIEEFLKFLRNKKKLK
ncbi:MAG: NUDIX domain-containing protein [Patescibacteria group bacterium]